MLHRLLVASFLATCCATTPRAQSPSPAPAGAARPTTPTAPVRRDDWQRAPAIFQALGATRGSRIADLGSGEGWLTTRLASHVGPTGRVFAVDISESSLKSLAERVQRDTLLRHVELILSEENDPRLPYASLDGVVIVNAYHEMTQRIAMLDGVKRALKPGGILVIVDNTPPDSVHTRKEQTAHHQLSLEFARDDLEAQGFEIVTADPNFIANRPDEHARRQWLLAARVRAK